MAEAAQSAEPRVSQRREGGGLSLETFAAFQQRHFRLLWLNTFSFALVHGIQRFAFVWLAIELSESSRALGIVSFAMGIPVLFISMPAGILSDRIDRRLILVTSQVVILAISILTAILIWAGLASVAMAAALALAVGVGVAFGQPVRQAIVPSIVPPDRLMNAITLISLGTNTSQMVGPAIGGLSIALWGIGGCFAVQATFVSLGLLALVPLRVPRPEGITNVRRNFREDTSEGLRFAIGTEGVRVLFLLLLVTAIFVNGPWGTLLPKIAEERLGRGAFGAGLIFSAFGGGMIVSSLILASIHELKNAGGWFAATMVCGGVLIVGMGLSKIYLLTLSLMLVSGVNAGFFMNLNLTLIQANTPGDVMGRVMAIYTLVFMGVTPLGALAAGAAADIFGPGEWFAFGGAAMSAVAVVILITQPKLRRMSSNPGSAR